MIDELARHPDPAALHARLRERGAHPLADGRWVVSCAADVAAVLGSPAAEIGFTPDPGSAPAAAQARMARFSDGPAHAPRRAAAAALLGGVDVDALREAAARATAPLVTGAAELDVMGAPARHVPVMVLAEALGVTDPAAARTATAALAQAVAPAPGTDPGTAGVAALAVLDRLLAHTADQDGADQDGASQDGKPTAAIGLLLQALDATAGLIGNAAAGLHEHPGAAVDDLLARALLADAPVQLTTRSAARTLVIGDLTVPARRRVVVVLAAASTDPAGSGTGFGFGAGPHACPGARHATALAAGVLDALVAAGATVPERPRSYEPRINLRVPTRLVVRFGPVSAAPSGSPRRAG